MDVVLQGPFHQYTPQVINEFRKQDWVDTIIISTWQREPVDLTGIDESNIVVIFNEDVSHPGVGNRNRQIRSSYAGLDIVYSSVSIKARTDQIVYDLPMMKEFYDQYATDHELFTCGLYRAFPFHPRDHFLMGPTKYLRKFFSAPFDPYDGPANYRQCLRAEAWLGAHYYSQFSDVANYMKNNPLEYLVDGAPKIAEALAVDFSMRDKLFKVFPRINLAWPKHNLSEYHYHVGESFSEYWYESPVTV